MNRDDFRKLFMIIIFLVILGVLVVPLVIIILFTFDLPIVPTAPWCPADALAYASGLLGLIGTIVLGYISFKQSKYANNMVASSTKMAIQANELQLLSRLIDFERSNYEELKCSIDEFCEDCSPQVFLRFQNEIYFARSNNEEKYDCSLKIIIHRNKIRYAFERTSRILRQDKDFMSNGNDILNKTITELYQFADDYILFLLNEKFLNSPYLAQRNDEKLVSFDACYKSFYRIKENYIMKREDFLLKLILQKVTFDDAKNFYFDRSYV